MEESTMVGDNPRPEDCDDWTVRVCPVSQDVTIECHTLPESEDTGGGVLCTGFLDVEKLIVIKNKHHHHPKETVLLLEKKLPFQLLILRLKGHED